MKIAIVGAGISGLSTAFYINRFRPEWEIEIFEKEGTIGGKMQTHEQDGFLFEIGTNGFLSNKQDTLDLVMESNAQEMLLKSSDKARIRFIYKDKLHKLPESPKEFLKTELLSPFGKARVAMEFFTKAKKETTEESLESFGNRRLGKEFTDVFLDAMSAGIFGSTPKKLSVNAAFPLVVNLEKEYGGLFRGMKAKKKKDAGPGGVLTSFNKGVGEFVEHLKSTLNATFHTYADVDNLTREGDGYRLHTKTDFRYFDKVILASPSDASAKILKELDLELANELDSIPYTPMSVVGFGYDTLDHDLLGFGLLTTTSAQKEVLGVLWDSSIFVNRAPLGKKSLRVMIGGQRQPELALKSEGELVEIAKKGIRETMGAEAIPSSVFVKKWERAIPSYEVGHIAKRERIFEKLQKHNGIYLNSNAYFGVGLNDCTKNSKICALEVCEMDLE